MPYTTEVTVFDGFTRQEKKWLLDWSMRHLADHDTVSARNNTRKLVNSVERGLKGLPMSQVGSLLCDALLCGDEEAFEEFVRETNRFCRAEPSIATIH